MQWNVVRQEDGSETEGKGLQNCGQTSSVVWCTCKSICFHKKCAWLFLPPIPCTVDRPPAVDPPTGGPTPCSGPTPVVDPPPVCLFAVFLHLASQRFVWLVTGALHWYF